MTYIIEDIKAESARVAATHDAEPWKQAHDAAMAALTVEAYGLAVERLVKVCAMVQSAFERLSPEIRTEAAEVLKAAFENLHRTLPSLASLVRTTRVSDYGSAISADRIDQWATYVEQTALPVATGELTLDPPDPSHLRARAEARRARARHDEDAGGGPAR